MQRIVSGSDITIHSHMKAQVLLTAYKSVKEGNFDRHKRVYPKQKSYDVSALVLRVERTFHKKGERWKCTNPGAFLCFFFNFLEQNFYILVK